MNAKSAIVNMMVLLFFTVFVALTAAQNVDVHKACADESLRLLNSYRASRGLPTLAINSEAHGRAGNHSKSMASADHLYHSHRSYYIDAENVGQA